MPRTSNRAAMSDNNDTSEDIIRDFEQEVIPCLRQLLNESEEIVEPSKNDRQRLKDIRNQMNSVGLAGGNMRTSKKRSSSSSKAGVTAKKSRTTTAKKPNKKACSKRSTAKKAGTTRIMPVQELMLKENEPEITIGAQQQPVTSNTEKSTATNRTKKDDSQNYVIPWRCLKDAGWTYVNAARYNELDTGYYVRPGGTVKDGELGRDYFKDSKDAVKYLKKNNLSLSCVENSGGLEASLQDTGAGRLGSETVGTDGNTSPVTDKGIPKATMEETENPTSEKRHHDESIVAGATLPKSGAEFTDTVAGKENNALSFLSPATQNRRNQWDTVQKTAQTAKKKNDSSDEALHNLKKTVKTTKKSKRALEDKLKSKLKNKRRLPTHERAASDDVEKDETPRISGGESVLSKEKLD